LHFRFGFPLQLGYLAALELDMIVSQIERVRNFREPVNLPAVRPRVLEYDSTSDVPRKVVC
jgi:hypothetical protein